MAGSRYTCSFTAPFTGRAGALQVTRIAVTVVDNEGTSVPRQHRPFRGHHRADGRCVSIHHFTDDCSAHDHVTHDHVTDDPVTHDHSAHDYSADNDSPDDDSAYEHSSAGGSPDSVFPLTACITRWCDENTRTALVRNRVHGKWPTLRRHHGGRPGTARIGARGLRPNEARPRLDGGIELAQASHVRGERPRIRRM